MGDARLSFPEMSSAWRSGTRQHLLGSDYVTYEPTAHVEQQPSIVEFDIMSNQTFMFGPMSRFNMAGVFQGKTAEGDWAPLVEADVSKVNVQPNFFPHMIKEIAVFHGNYKLSTSDESRHISPYTETFLNAYMDELGHKLLCPQACHPGNGVPTTKNGWSVDGGKEWVAYGKTIFTGDTINFDYIPMHMFPFFQRANFLIDKNFPSPLPMPALGKLTIRISFNDKLDNIFKPKAAETRKFRFAFSSIQLMVEQARLSSNFERQFYTKKSLLPYSGVTKIMIGETIGTANLTHRTRFQDVPFPEGLFVFALPKKCMNGTYSWKDNTDWNIFSPHNIEKINFTYGGLTYYMKEPNMSMIENENMEVKQLIDHLASPPFGMTMDPKKLTLESVASGGSNTPYPHVYLNFCNYGSEKTRIIPLLNDGSVLAQNQDLDLTVEFKAAGATADVTYFFYIFFTDTNMILDMKTKTFYSPYIKK